MIESEFWPILTTFIQFLLDIYFDILYKVDEKSLSTA